MNQKTTPLPLLPGARLVTSVNETMAKKANSPTLWYLKIPVAQQRFFDNASDAEGMAALILAFYCGRTSPNGGNVENARELLEDKRTARAHGFKSQHRKILLNTQSIPGLWHWKDATLVSDIYPAAVEAELLAKSKGGTASAEKRKATKEQQKESYAPAVNLNNL